MVLLRRTEFVDVGRLRAEDLAGKPPEQLGETWWDLELPGVRFLGHDGVDEKPTTI